MTADDLDKLLNDPKTWVVTEFNNPNTQLYAAAPELLHALQMLTDPLYLAGLNQSAEHHPFIAKARLAIAKATGEQK